MSDIKTTYGALGDTQDVTSTITIGAGGFAANRLHFTAATPFVAGDVGKVISIGGAGTAGATHGNYLPPITITNYVNSSTVDISVNAPTPLTASSQRVVWGADDSAAFSSFNTANAGASGVLTTIPAGSYSVGSINQFCIGQGISQFELRGAGSATTTITNAALTDSSLFLGAFFGVYQTPDTWANVVTVPAGATSVTLITAAEDAIFSVGAYVLLAGLDGFGLWEGGGVGYPPDNFFYDYVKITAINSGVITFDRPVRYNYLSTWPLFDAGPPYEGGPAVLYKLKPEWNSDAAYTGFTLESIGAATNSICRRITYRDIIFLNASACYPTQSLEINAYDCDWRPAGTLEFDKQTVAFNATDCSFHDIFVQSSSPEIFAMIRCSVEHGMQTPRNLVATDCDISSLNFGCAVTGYTQSVKATGCTIDAVTQSPANVTIGAGWSMTHGLIKVPNTDSVAANVIGWAVPGAFFTFVGALNSNRVYRVMRVTQDATYCYIQTNAPRGFPTGTGQNIVRVSAHPCLDVTFNNCTSDDVSVLDICTAPPGRPLYSHVKRTYAAAGPEPGTPGAQEPFEVWGRLVSMTINVTKAYSGVQATLFFLLSNDSLNNVLDGDDAIYNYFPQIDLKQTGLRTVTPSGVTGSVGGDTGLSWPTNGWWGGNNSGPAYSANISGESSTLWPTIEI